MLETMKAVAAVGCGRTAIVKIPRPVPGDYECLTKILYCGICNGTDLKLIHDQVTDLKIPYPTVLGHESVGRIVAVGKKVRYWKVGDRVVSPIGSIAPESGFRSHYGQMAEFGITHDIRAMMEDHINLGNQPPIPDYRGKLIPPEMSFRDAVMLLTFKENYSALNNFAFRPGMDVLICGDGPVAMGIACIAKALGAASVSCVGHHNHRLEHIHACANVNGVINSRECRVLETLAGQRLDMIVDAVGDLDTDRALAPLLRPGGVLGLYGVLSGAHGNMNLFEWPNNIRLHILNWPYGEHRAHEAVTALVARGVLVPSQYYTHILPLEDAQKGFELVASREAFKVILQMPGTDEE